MEFRQALAAKLKELMLKDETICILDADLAKPNGTAPLYKKFPNRCFNVGIAEANMVGVAAGLAASNMKPNVFSFAPFSTRRALDQIMISVCYAKQNVKIWGTDPGITAETNGGTHMSFEDMGVLRSIPTMAIFDVVDANQLQQAVEQIENYQGPMYIRMPRKARPDVYDNDYKFELFKADVLNTGTDITIIASGTMVYEAKLAVEELKKQGIEAELISANFIKPLDERTLLTSINKTKLVLTCENHNVIGGLHSAVCELVCHNTPVKVYAIGVQDQFGQVGKYNDLLKEYHMTKDDIIAKVTKILKNK